MSIRPRWKPGRISNLAMASALATTDELKRRVTDMQRRSGRLRERGRRGDRGSATQPASAATTQATTHGTLSGALRFADGQPVASATVTLGLHIGRRGESPAGDVSSGMGYRLRMGPMSSLTAKTDAKGHFRLEQVPTRPARIPCRHGLDPARFAIATRFLARDINVIDNRETAVAYTVTDWQSAPAPQVTNPFPATLSRDGITYQRILLQPLTNPFDYDFPRQLLELDLPAGSPQKSNHLLLLSSTDSTGAHALPASQRAYRVLHPPPRHVRPRVCGL